MNADARPRSRRAVITLATTKDIYVQMAFTMARSFLYWNRDSGIDFHLMTDLDLVLPADFGGIKLARFAPGELGSGFSPKLHLDRLSPAPQTLFIDADCLCVQPLTSVFDRFAGREVSVVGGTIATGKWWGDIDRLRAELCVGPLPYFN